MEVIHKRRSGTELSQLIQNGKPAGQAGRDKRTEVSPPILSAKVTISKKGREPQRITEPLARSGSLVLVAHASSERREWIAVDERVTDRFAPAGGA